MSETTSPTPVTPKAPDPVQPLVPSSDNWKSPQTIIALYCLTIGAGVLVAIAKLPDLTPVQAGLFGTALGAVLVAPAAYYFGSSKSSQDKDTTVAAIATAPKSTQ